ncbi:MAG: hypothetical protein ACOCUI_02220 [bacterium]
MFRPHEDPLFVVNPKLPCPHCNNERKQRKQCDFCKHSGMKPINLSGMWHPSPGFLVCGGPSINKLPIEKLKDRGIVSLGVNNISGHVPIDAWTFSDPQKKFHHGLFLDPKNITFAPIPKLKKHVRGKLPDGSFRIINKRVRDCPSVFGYERKTIFYPEEFFSTEYGHWGMGGKQENRDFTCLCTMLLGIRLMHYLGCPKIYMLGVDFWMTKEEQYAFNQKKNARNGRYKKENEMLKRLIPTFKKYNFEVYNCNPNSKCDVFPYISFDNAIADCKGGVPEEPFDLSGWYDKGICNNYEKKYPKPIEILEFKKLLTNSKSI